MAINTAHEAILISMAHREAERQRAEEARPWESGVVGYDWRNPPTDRADRLSAELRALVDVLVQNNVIPPDAINNRLAEIEREQEERAAAREEEERLAAETKRQRTVECVACKRVILASDSYYSGQGTLCARCHTANS